MMKSQMTWIGLVLVSLFCINAMAQDSGGASVLSAKRLNNSTDKTGQFGIGAQAGTYSGVTSEFWQANDRAYVGTIGFRGRNSAFSISHNWFARGTFSGIAEPLVPFIGIGGLAVFGNGADTLDRNRETFAFGAQIPVGVEYLPFSQRFGIFGQVAPGFEVTPIAVGFITGDIGARFYF